MFVDNVELSLLSGAGGSGSISFKSKGTKSSPNGGSGGDGGSIYFNSDSSIYDFSSIIETSKNAEFGSINSNLEYNMSKQPSMLILVLFLIEEIIFQLR